MDSTDTLSRSCCRERRLNKQVNSINALSRSRCRERRLKIPKNMAKNDFQYGGWNSYTLQCGMWMMWLWNRDTEFTQVAAPCIVAGGSDDMPLNSPKRPPYWNSTPGFDFDHITAVDMSFCNSLRHFIQIGRPSAEKMTSCLFWRWRISAILYFRDSIMGSLKAQLQLTKLLSFPENHIFAFWHQHPGSWILGVPYWVLWKANVRLSIGRQ